MARRLREEGETVALLALLDAPFPRRRAGARAWLLRRAPRACCWPPSALALLSGARLATTSASCGDLPSGRIAYALRLGGVGARGLGAPGPARARSEFLARRASYVGAAHGVVARAASTADRSLVESEDGAARRRRAWSRLAAGVEIVRVPGGHAGFIVDHGAAVGAALRRALERVRGSRSPDLGPIRRASGRGAPLGLELPPVLLVEREVRVPAEAAEGRVLPVVHEGVARAADLRPAARTRRL